jgi:hypothetical protein
MPPTPGDPRKRTAERPCSREESRPAPVSPGMAYPACYAGGRGFESRRSRLLKYVQRRIFRCLSRRDFCSEIHRLLPEPVCAWKSVLRTTCK